MSWLWHYPITAVKELCPLPVKIMNPSPNQNSMFGAALAARDGIIAVRDYRNPFNVRVYDLNTVQLINTITPPNTGDIPYANFHGNFAVGGGRVAVTGQTAKSGIQVFLYDKNDPKYKFTLSDPGAPGDWFGVSVDITGDVAVVGAPFASGGRGAAYLFDLKDPAKAPVTIQGPKPYGPNDLFGMAVATDGTTVAVGSPGRLVTFGKKPNYHQTPAGAVFLFDSKGQLLRTVTSPDDVVAGAAFLSFGVPMTFRSGVLALGSPSASVNGVQGAGAVYVSGPGKKMPYRLVSPTPAAHKWFGQSIGIGGSFIVVGCWDRTLNDSFPHAAEAAVFSLGSGEFVCAATNPPSASDAWNAFGAGDVAADDDQYVVGAWADFPSGYLAAGAMYVYRLEEVIVATGANAIIDPWPVSPIPNPGPELLRTGTRARRASTRSPQARSARARRSR